MPLTPTFATPDPFLEIRVEIHDGETPLTALCAGFERGEWRQADFVKYLFSYLLEFAFKWSELKKLNSATASRMIEEAAKRVYNTPEFGRRGEFGELLLHAALRNHFGTEPAVAKLFYKTGDNDVVKGFDAVHVTENDDGQLELWLGEAKFYADLGDAIRKAADSLEELTQTERLKREFVIVRGFVDDEWPYAAEFKELTHGKSLDEVFPVLRIPVLLTYDSDAVNSSGAVSEEYVEALREEATDALRRMSEADLPTDIFVHVILVPLKSKEKFVAALHQQLQHYQA